MYYCYSVCKLNNSFAAFTPQMYNLTDAGFWQIWEHTFAQYIILKSHIYAARTGYAAAAKCGSMGARILDILEQKMCLVFRK